MARQTRVIIRGRVMDEKKIKKQLLRITVLIISVSIVVSALVLIAFSYVIQQAHDTDHTQMKIETEEYESRILKQIDKNIQFLTSLAKAFEVNDLTASTELIEKNLSAINETNSFVSMAYLSVDGKGIINSTEYGTKWEITLDDCADYARTAIEKSFKGEDAVSKMFDSEIFDGKLFIYSVPVYKNDEIIGALAASDTLEIFEDIVNGNTVLDGQGYIHILDSAGNFLVRSEHTIVKENMSSIFDGPYLSEKIQEKAHEAIANRESMYGEFEYKGNECHFYLAPIDLNGWYLFCANSMWGPALSFSRSVVILGVFLFFVLLAMFTLLYYGYYRFRKNSSLLIRFAYYDRVTGADNTLRFDRKKEEITKKHKDYCIAALNIHNFKCINDIFGIEDGNKVLRFIKAKIEENLKPDEFFCRDSADLFYIFLLDTDESILSRRISSVILNVREVTQHAAYSYEVSLYSGLSIRGTREQALVALQSIKHNLQTDIAFYDHSLHEMVRKKSKIESHMQLALQRNEFKLFLQSKRDLKTGRITGAEALVRWQLPDGSYRYPGDFIPLFEANGFSVKLDMYMFEKVCIQLRKWIDLGINPIPISVNQSKRLFANGNYPEDIEKIVRKYNISPSLITLEILEDIAASDADQINYQINALQKIGFKISMDDFGSGYSSLNMLYTLKIDELKLDRGFMRKVAGGDDERRKIILKQIISFAKKLGITTVAEGIETEEDRNNMAALSCDYGQGYFFDKPTEAEEFSRLYMQK